jgi:hypothetical protein
MREGRYGINSHERATPHPLPPLPQGAYPSPPAPSPARGEGNPLRVHLMDKSALLGRFFSLSLASNSGKRQDSAPSPLAGEGGNSSVDPNAFAGEGLARSCIKSAAR